MMNILIVEPHFDDAWLNLGGYMLLHPEDKFFIFPGVLHSAFRSKALLLSLFDPGIRIFPKSNDRFWYDICISFFK